MNRNTEQDTELLGRLSSLIASDFASDVAPRLAVEWHVETLPYHAVLTALADHCGDCGQCFTDGDGTTTCEEALVLEFAAQYEIDNQFVMSLLN